MTVSTSRWIPQYGATAAHSTWNDFATLETVCLQSKRPGFGLPLTWSRSKVMLNLDILFHSLELPFAIELNGKQSLSGFRYVGDYGNCGASRLCLTGHDKSWSGCIKRCWSTCCPIFLLNVSRASCPSSFALSTHLGGLRIDFARRRSEYQARLTDTSSTTWTTSMTSSARKVYTDSVKSSAIMNKDGYMLHSWGLEQWYRLQ